MTEQEEAIQLFEQMLSNIPTGELDKEDHNEAAKDCAIVACDLVLQAIEDISNGMESNLSQYHSWKLIKEIIIAKE